MTEKTYEDYVLENGETKRDLDVVYNPIFKNLKTAFSLMFASDNMSGSDFKRLSDMQYYQGGYPSPATPPKEHALAVQVANLIKLERSLDKTNFIDFLQSLGVTVDYDQIEYPALGYTLSKEDEKKLVESWEGAGIDKKIPTDKGEALQLLLDRAQNIQKEICEVSDSIKVTAAEEVEGKFKIAKGNFMKAVNLAAVRLKRGDGVMGEKIDDVVDGTENLLEAIRPLMHGTK